MCKIHWKIQCVCYLCVILLQFTVYVLFVFIVQEISLKIEYLEMYYILLSAIEVNLAEFKTVKDKIAQIVQDVKALAVMDELSDDEVFEISTMLPYTNAPGESVSQSTFCLNAAQGPSQQPSLQSHRASLVSGENSIRLVLIT